MTTVLLGGAVLALSIARRNRRAVKSGRWYLLLNERIRVQSMLPTSWMEDASPLILLRIFDVLEREPR